MDQFIFETKEGKMFIMHREAVTVDEFVMIAKELGVIGQD